MHDGVGCRTVRGSGLVRAATAWIALMAAVVSAGCAHSIQSVSLPMEQDFTDCAQFGMNDEVATVDCPGGELRIVVSKPAVSPMHFVPLRFDERPTAVRVTAAARSESAPAVWGLGCLASGPGEAARGYVLLMDNEGSLVIIRIVGTETGEREAIQFRSLKFRERVVERPAARHSLGLTCSSNASGRTSVEGSVDGRPVVRGTDRSGFAAYTAALPFVFAERPGTEVRFDDVTASEASAP